MLCPFLPFLTFFPLRKKSNIKNSQKKSKMAKHRHSRKIPYKNHVKIPHSYPLQGAVMYISAGISCRKGQGCYRSKDGSSFPGRAYIPIYSPYVLTATPYGSCYISRKSKVCLLVHVGATWPLSIHNSPLKGIGVRDISIGDFYAMPVLAVFGYFSNSFLRF